jgi:hypothetical protein
MNTTNHTSPSGEDAANGAIGEQEHPFAALCDLLPADVSWGDSLTPDIARHIVIAARAALTAEKVAAEPIYQFRVSGCSDWYDGHPDLTDGRTYETRMVVAVPQLAQTQVALTDEHIRKIAEEHFWGGKCTTADDLEKAIVAALREASLAAQPVSGVDHD